MDDKALHRLLRSAGAEKKDEVATMPLGFDTRVIALWRSTPAEFNGVSLLIRRVMLVASIVIVVAATGAFQEINQSRDLGEPLSNEFAIADSVIQNEFDQ